MIRKILGVLFLAALTVIVAASVSARWSYGLVWKDWQEGWQKSFVHSSIKYRFPLVYELSDWRMAETGEFAGDISLRADKVELSVDVPASLRHRRIEVGVWLDGAEIVYRKNQNRITGVFPWRPLTGPAARFIRITHIEAHHSLLRWIDYDISKKGFAVEFKDLEAQIRLNGESVAGRTFEIKGFLPQARMFGKASVAFELQSDAAGWELKTTVEDLWIPTLSAYSSEIAQAEITDGIARADFKAGSKGKEFKWDGTLSLRRLNLAAPEGAADILGLPAPTLKTWFRHAPEETVLVLSKTVDRTSDSTGFIALFRDALSRSLKERITYDIHSPEQGLQAPVF